MDVHHAQPAGSGQREAQRHRRRGGAYVLVVILSAIVAVLGTGGLLLRERVFEIADRRSGSAAARTLARSSAELAIQMVHDGFDVSSAWVGLPFVDFDLDDGTLEAYRTGTPTDGQVTIRGAGLIGDARAYLDFEMDVSVGYRDRALALSPVAHWPFDEIAAEAPAGVVDVVGAANGVHADITAAGTSTGPDGEPAPWFDAGLDAVGVSHRDWMELSEATFSMWVFTPHAFDWGVALSKGSSFANQATTWVYVSAGNAVVSIEDSGTVRTVWGAVASESWVHVAFTAGNDGLYLYVNGREAMHNSSKIRDIGDATTSLTIGAVYYEGTGTIGDHIKGSVREVSVFDSVLGAAEIASLAGSGWNESLDPPEVVAGSWRWGVE
ncbi:MAG: LamG-like jellyroll fold domain-containing protein [Planctomycetota bacterium]